MSRVILCLTLLCLACSGTSVPRRGATFESPMPASMGPVLGDESTLAFVDVSVALGISEVAFPADLEKAKIIGTMGGGVAWGDYDADGDPDLYVTQGIKKYRPGMEPKNCGLLYRNDGLFGFVEVAEKSGLHACGWGSGALFEDLDADGDLDLFLTFVGDNQLWINAGDGTFSEVAKTWGLSAHGYNSGAAFLDYDRDGDLDLYLVRYVETTIEAEMAWPSLDLRLPEDYAPPRNALLRQDSLTSWVEVTDAAGAADDQGRGLSVVASDFDLDGWVDLFVANDRSSNTLLQNRGDGTFDDVTALAGVGVGADGHWQSAMGVAVADVDDNGYPDILVTNYVEEPNTLFLNLGELVFEDSTRSRGLYRSALPWVAWGSDFVDFDNDGKLDLYVVNGHLIPDFISRLGYWLHRKELVRTYTHGGYRQPVLLFRGREGGFDLVDSGEDGLLGRRIAGRGGSVADIDSDGRLDLFVMALSRSSPSALLLNRSGGLGGWLSLELRRSRAIRGRAVGARARVESSAGRKYLQVVSGGSYLSSSAVPLHTGLGSAERASIEVDWTSGSRLRYLDLKRDRRYVLH